MDLRWVSIRHIIKDPSLNRLIIEGLMEEYVSVSVLADVVCIRNILDSDEYSTCSPALSPTIVYMSMLSCFIIKPYMWNVPVVCGTAICMGPSPQSATSFTIPLREEITISDLCQSQA